MFGEEIRKLRKANGLTLIQLEELTGISHSYLSQLERGERGNKNPPTEIFSKLAKTLKVSKLHLYRAAGLLDEADILALLDENKRLRESLEYYADTKLYEPYCIPMGDYASDVTEDNGEIARKALQGGGEVK
ncbi:helix-turn-helix domain-containing protein [Lysinibacillus irui]|uniref:helix-turn-helix domain-containing protein n=1 Tax=Lysinibacillus irui TaxID=2998077 RepID=UPI002AD34DC3|nr:helix-turn-helix transcriptional regulator [Lysinibacillus irui]MEA0564056.1 helix-turn-helix transcriptional regulator [Lysinibacillus irui]